MLQHFFAMLKNSTFYLFIYFASSSSRLRRTGPRQRCADEHRAEELWPRLRQLVGNGEPARPSSCTLRTAPWEAKGPTGGGGGGWRGAGRRAMVGGGAERARDGEWWRLLGRKTWRQRRR
jgi:hypothetical protein